MFWDLGQSYLICPGPPLPALITFSKWWCLSAFLFPGQVSLISSGLTVKHSLLQWKHELLILSNPKTSCVIESLDFLHPTSNTWSYFKKLKNKTKQNFKKPTKWKLSKKSLHCSKPPLYGKKKSWTQPAAAFPPESWVQKAVVAMV